MTSFSNRNQTTTGNMAISFQSSKTHNTWRKILLALGLILLCLASFLADDAVAAVFRAVHCRRLSTVAFLLNQIGDWSFHSVAALIAAAIAWQMRRKELARLLVTMVLASSMAGIAVNTVRLSSGRPRPSTKVQDGFYGLQKDGQWIVGKHSYQSFPSAHTATATAFAGVALFAGIRYGWLIALFGPLVGCARIYSSAHHFSDVITATVIGLLFSQWAWNFAQERWHPKSEPLSESSMVPT